MTGTVSLSAAVERRATAARRRSIERLRLAMEPEAVRDALQRSWLYARQRELTVEECRLLRVHERAQDEFILEYEVALAGPDGVASKPLLAELTPEDPRRRCEQVALSLGKARRKQLSSRTPAGAVSCLEELGLVVRLPGLDERLPGLKLLHKPKILRTILAERLLEGERRPTLGSATVLGHRLGKRCTVRFGLSCGERRGSLIAKMYKQRGDGARRLSSLMQRLRGSGFGESSRIRVPAPLALLGRWQTQLMEDASGTRLAELEGEEYRAGCELAGETLARLHSSRLRVEAAHSVEDELELLGRRAVLTGEVHPDLEPAVERGYRKVRRALQRCRAAPSVLVHRDFYDRQILIAGDRAVLIDLDTLCVADPAIDLGNFLAHLRLARPQGVAPADGAEAAFLAGYGLAATAELERRVGAYRDAALLRLACLGSFQRRWRGLTEELIREVG